MAKKPARLKTEVKTITLGGVEGVATYAPAAPSPVLTRQAMACRMSPELARQIRGRFRVEIPIPTDETVRDVAVGARLLLREWIGAATGRADLVHVVAVGIADKAGTCTVERRWCWASGKTDDDLSALGLTVLPDHFPAVGY